MLSADDLCRLCASQNGKMLAIYSEEGIFTRLEHKINSYLPIKVSEQDDLPLQCCCGCTSLLLAWHQMFVSCIEAEKRLRNFEIVNQFSHSPSVSCDQSSDNVDSDLEGDKVSKAITSLQEENCKTLCTNKEKQELVGKNPDFVRTPTAIHVFQNTYPCDRCKTILCNESDLIDHLKIHKTTILKKSKRISTSDTLIKRQLNVLTCEDVCTYALNTDQTQHISEPNTAFICEDQSKSIKNSPNEVSVIIDNKQHPNNVGIIGVNTDNNDCLEETKGDKLKLKNEQMESCVLENKVFKDKIDAFIDSTSKTCKLCNLNFEKKVNLNKHLFLVHNLKAPKARRKHSEIEAVAFCDICDKGFTRRFDMIKHRKNKHNILQHDTDSSLNRASIVKRCTVQNGDGKQMYKCDICGHIFKQSYSLMRHHTIHTGDRPYFCEMCGKDFRTASGLNRHVNEFHYAIKKFQCEVCSKQFKTRATKDEHMNIHTDTRPYVCDICGKAYRQKASLYVHKTYHTNNFRFSCSVCGNKYRRAQELKVHKWSHTGHKPFKCQVCDVEFRLKHDLKKHSELICNVTDKLTTYLIDPRHQTF